MSKEWVKPAFLDTSRAEPADSNTIFICIGYRPAK